MENTNLTKQDKLDRHSIEEVEGWKKHEHVVPFFKIRPNYQIKICPPTGGALLRFLIRYTNHTPVSIYFDAHNMLGSKYSSPGNYFEYSYSSPERNHSNRFPESDFVEMLKEIYLIFEDKEVLLKEEPHLFF